MRCGSPGNCQGSRASTFLLAARSYPGCRHRAGHVNDEVSIQVVNLLVERPRTQPPFLASDSVEVPAFQQPREEFLGEILRMLGS